MTIIYILIGVLFLSVWGMSSKIEEQGREIEELNDRLDELDAGDDDMYDPEVGI